MAAITVTGYLVPAGARIIAPHDCYGGTYRLFDAWRRRGERQVEFVDFGDAAALRAALSTPARCCGSRLRSNPLLRITDIAACVQLGRAAGALTVVDNTFLSPGWQQPLTLGADLVVHSTTKYINGHSDVVGGAVIARDAALAGELTWWANCLGLTGAPFDSFMTLRGLRTLHARLEHHGRNAQALAEWLNTRAECGACGSRALPAASRARAGEASAEGLRCGRDAGAGGRPRGSARIRRWPGVLLARRSPWAAWRAWSPTRPSMTHAAMDPAARAAPGLSDGLIRLSIGIEGLEDLRAGPGARAGAGGAGDRAAEPQPRRVRLLSTAAPARGRDARVAPRWCEIGRCARPRRVPGALPARARAASACSPSECRSSSAHAEDRAVGVGDAASGDVGAEPWMGS